MGSSDMGIGAKGSRRSARGAIWATARLVLPLVGGAMLSGCISVKAPDKPIVIELNINIKQEVIYRLAGDAAQTIDKNAEIF
ncbi:YnbE family lipoprotein [Novosphingobium sp. FKTRR1]|uniref:YnbE family lipoprotein n=1 Tax=unclassified Novosphingobium TaxID=2644732 RepID=UPI001CEFC42A|nr:YnbE family lipoprotein [Novosphingobium sp. FKTRR1]